MKKRILALALGILFAVNLTGCAKEIKGGSSDNDISSQNTSSEEQLTPTYFTNPLTGVEELTANQVDLRPVAVMINNISVAQPVQAGLDAADIVYETEVEGGITRLMAVFKDVRKADRLGSIRSARYPYVDLAMGHDAIYVHCGQDPTYCAPHLKDTDDYSIDTNNGGKRIANGLSSEHTLYTFGNDLFNALTKKFKRTTVSSNTMWQDFAAADESVSFAENVANQVSVQFSQAYNTTFKYNASTGKYTRYSGAAARNDYISGKPMEFKNIFVLLTRITTYPDGKHRKVALESGSGYYITNGTYTPINWSKGDASGSFKFTDASGKPIRVNAGNSYVMLPDSSTSRPSFS